MRTIDWSDNAPWGNRVTVAANGSWVDTEAGEDQ